MRLFPIRLMFGLALVVAPVGCGDDGIKSGGPDLAAAQDGATGDLQMSLTDAAGISCGSTAVCLKPQVCCAQVVAGAPQFMCVAPAACPADGGIITTCDGPQSCTTDAPNCCAAIAFTGGTDPDAGPPMAQGGGAMCTPTCPASFTLGSVSLAHTKLCHTNSDCANYSGPIFGTTTPFDACCSTTLAPGEHFCAPNQYAGVAPYTCP